MDLDIVAKGRMIQAKKLMTELTDQGVEFFVQGREIRIISGKGIITDAIMSRLVVRKPEMIKILNEAQTLRLVVDNTEGIIDVFLSQ